jgi:hypothetical protein
MSKPEVFLSYCAEDAIACDRIEQALTAAGCTIWRDQGSMAPGRSWVRCIFAGISSADFVIPLLSESSLRSPWVEREVDTALAKSMIRGSELAIVPVVLERVQIPDELVVLPCIDFSSDFSAGLDALVMHIRKRSSAPSLDPGGKVGYCESITHIDSSLFAALGSNRAIPGPSQLELWRLHQQLLRLQAVVEHISRMPKDEAESLWRMAGEAMPGPIAGAQKVAENIYRNLRSCNEDERLKMSVLARYVSIMGEVVKSMRGSVLTAIPLTSPQIAERLTRLFQSKVSIYQSVQRLHAEAAEQSHCLDDALLEYIEAARTLESRGLLQLIDADARSIAHQGVGGITVFAEFVTQGPAIIQAIIDLRRRIGALLRSVGFNPGHPHAAHA